MASTNKSPLPLTMNSLVQAAPSQPFNFGPSPTPSPLPGTAIVRILHAGVNSYFKAVYQGDRGLPYPTPLIPGPSAVGRVVALGPDSTALKIDDLVYVDCVVRSRDDPNNHMFLLGFMQGLTEGSLKLMRDVWRDGTYAEFCRVPLENVYVLNEERLRSREADLASLNRYLVCYGGLRGVGIQAGETVVVAPATGGFSGAGVAVAVAMGASVIAMGRNEEALMKLTKLFGDTGRLKTVKITGDAEYDAEELRKASVGGSIDAALDISPPMAAESTHLKSIISAMGSGGRISMMGGIPGDVMIPYGAIMLKSLTLQGKWMYERRDAQALIKMVESGLLRIGSDGGVKVEAFKFEDWGKAFDRAEEKAGWDHFVVIGSEVKR
ncbi:alcohol dehydrogenase [Dendryphion nanum]|uniref:Alcohol dehydrogenase n=1 Tax=Dendryphion nanum TaxID=256645 RepID=A0A9P9DWL5_9PLEO|nr:alcohol dehydrogenase [Dendryphion nanum]